MTDFELIGVVHLLPLPGGPHSTHSFQDVLKRALADASTLVMNGVHSIVVENFGDAPFCSHEVQPHVTAFMSIVAHEIRKSHGANINIGINVLRNDASSALAVAAAANAQFIRVNVHSGSAWTDQGLIHGQAYQTLMYRKTLNLSHVKIAADVLVKHASPAGRSCIASLTEDLLYRAKADIVIVTGSGTGKAIVVQDLKDCRRVVPDSTLWLGSGVSPANIDAIRHYANGCIVGTFFHQDSNLQKPLDAERVKAMVACV